MKTALLFANGQVTPAEFVKIRGVEFDTVIAADGGARHALQWDMLPDYVVGDLDSISPEIREQLHPSQFLHRPSQELNDLEKALQLCREREVTHITLLGACGNRLDHTLNNLSVLSRYDRIFQFTIFDAHAQIFIVRDEWHYAGKTGQVISLIPLGQVAGVTTKGLAFPLKNESLNFAEREGGSNRIVSTPVSVSIRKGLLFIFAVDS